jgi:hypothetical protein
MLKKKQKENIKHIDIYRFGPISTYNQIILKYAAIKALKSVWKRQINLEIKPNKQGSV